MLAGKHLIDQDTHGIDVRPCVCLGESVLFRRRVAGSSHDLGICVVFRFHQTGHIKIDEHRFIAPDDNIFRLDIPVHRPQTMQDLQRFADLHGNLFGLRLGKRASFQQKRKGISLNVLFQDINLPVLFLNAIDFRKMRAVNFL